MVAFNCPEGYVFEDSTNITHYAICHNWEYVYNFDLEAKCVRKYLALQHYISRFWFPALSSVASQCDCPPWFANGTQPGSTSLSKDDWTKCGKEGLTFFLDDEVTYTCPEGYVFETPDLVFQGNETQKLTLTCATFASWKPGLIPKCIRNLL